MARIRFGLATSHGPMLSIPSEYWVDRVSADRENPRHFFKGKTYSFDEMVDLRRGDNLAAQIPPPGRVLRPAPAGCRRCRRQ
jgi:hypothetical protein